MTIRSFTAISGRVNGQPLMPKMPLWKAVAFAAGLGLSSLSYPVHAAPASSGATVQGLYDALLSTMKNGRILGQSGRWPAPARGTRRAQSREKSRHRARSDRAGG